MQGHPSPHNPSLLEIRRVEEVWNHSDKSNKIQDLPCPVSPPSKHAGITLSIGSIELSTVYELIFRTTDRRRGDLPMADPVPKMQFRIFSWFYGPRPSNFYIEVCYFTKREIYKLIRTHKKVFSENWLDLDYKINYLKIMLFASTRDIVESGALAYPIDHIRQRYLFVYRAGLFKRVRREEQYILQRDLNISLIDIFSTSISTFFKKNNK